MSILKAIKREREKTQSSTNKVKINRTESVRLQKPWEIDGPRSNDREEARNVAAARANISKATKKRWAKFRAQAKKVRSRFSGTSGSVSHLSGHGVNHQHDSPAEHRSLNAETRNPHRR